jgi:hypothetical protein
MSEETGINTNDALSFQEQVDQGLCLEVSSDTVVLEFQSQQTIVWKYEP